MKIRTLLTFEYWHWMSPTDHSSDRFIALREIGSGSDIVWTEPITFTNGAFCNVSRHTTQKTINAIRNAGIEVVPM